MFVLKYAVDKFLYCISADIKLFSVYGKISRNKSFRNGVVYFSDIAERILNLFAFDCINETKSRFLRVKIYTVIVFMRDKIVINKPFVII